MLMIILYTVVCHRKVKYFPIPSRLFGVYYATRQRAATNIMLRGQKLEEVKSFSYFKSTLTKGRTFTKKDKKDLL